MFGRPVQSKRLHRAFLCPKIKEFFVMKKFFKTAQTALRTQTNGGIVYLFPQIILKIIYLIPLMFIWRIVTESGVDSSMTLTQLLSYTYINALLSNVLSVNTFINDWDSAGKCAVLYTRPFSVIAQVISPTVGGWIPTLLLFSLPMAAIASLFGIQIIPSTQWVIPSILLCASLGFAFEFLFFCITLRLQNVVWLMWVIRSAVVSFFSGTVIPFKILPFGMDKWMMYQPFGSLGGAPLSLYIGSAEPMQIIPTQIIWNTVIWTIALIWFNKSRERIVSYGG
jgi:ABC-2 type transport system permease protein